MSAEPRQDLDDLTHYMRAVSRLRDALWSIRDLDPDLTHDGFDRGPDSRYEDEVYAIADMALNPTRSESPSGAVATPKSSGGGR